MLIVNSIDIIQTECAMNQHKYSPTHSNSHVVSNVISKLRTVKGVVSKISTYSLGLFFYASLTLSSSAAHAEDVNARAIMNSTQLLNYLDGVVPEAMPNLLAAIQSGHVRRIEPSFPVWIISSDTGNLLFYQGQKEFVGQSASRLVDDKGFRFGQRALDMARNSKSTWVKLELNAQVYKAYCASKAPFVVCTLVEPQA